MLAHSSPILFRSAFFLVSSFSQVKEAAGRAISDDIGELARALRAVPKVPKTFGDQVSAEVTWIAYYLRGRFTPFSPGSVRHAVPMTREIARSNSGRAVQRSATLFTLFKTAKVSRVDR